MRPVYMEISAFGPYAGKTVIPFDKLGESGLYLITGDTGSGKTTIFDAITFALFGEASGNGREAGMLRSKYADPSVETYVEMEFEYQGNTYRIHRNPAYERPKKRGEGTVIESADAILSYPDGRVIEGAEKTIKAITELIGVDRSHFCQIAMIAQGDFLKLLFSKTDERSKIFREIFNTGVFQTFQIKIKEKLKVLEDELKGYRDIIANGVRNIMCDSQSEFYEEWKKVTDENTGLNISEIIRLAECIIESDNLSETGIESKISETDAVFDELNIKEHAAERLIKAFKELKNTENDIEVLTINQNGLLKDYENIRDEYEGIAGLKVTIEEEKKNLNNYAEAKKLRKDISDKENKYNMLCKRHEEDTGTIKKSEQQSEELQKEKEEIKDCHETLAELEKEKVLTDNKLKLLREAESLIKHHMVLQKELLNAQNDYLKASKVCKIQRASTEKIMQDFLDAQAGILAQTLTDGQPCPVCGSIHHPYPMPLHTDAPDKETVDKAKKLLQEAERIQNESSRKAGELGVKADNSLNILKDKMALIDDTANLTKKLSDMESAGQEVLRYKEDVIKASDEITSKISSVNLQVERAEYIEKQIPVIRKNINLLVDRLHETEVNKTRLETELKSLRAENDRICKLLKYGSEEEAMQNILSMEKKAEQIEKENNRINISLKQCEEQLAVAKNRKESLDKELHGKEIPDMDFLTKEIERVRTDKRKLREQKEQVVSANTFNKKTLERIKECSEKITATEEKWTQIKAVADTANGNLSKSGKARITLETYVQINYFEHIIIRANRRFLKMSQGRYELKRCNEARNLKEQTGLELNVIDHYNGSERSVRTLSGGEAFMASLSLALGMADEVQEMSGGIKLDTLFIDEGFGTLDEESLNQAMKVLNGLTEGNRLVGIISHVSELKNRIDKQLVVTRTAAGKSGININI